MAKAPTLATTRGQIPARMDLRQLPRVARWLLEGEHRLTALSNPTLPDALVRDALEARGTKNPLTLTGPERLAVVTNHPLPGDLLDIALATSRPAGVLQALVCRADFTVEHATELAARPGLPAAVTRELRDAGLDTALLQAASEYAGRHIQFDWIDDMGDRLPLDEHARMLRDAGWIMGAGTRGIAGMGASIARWISRDPSMRDAALVSTNRNVRMALAGLPELSVAAAWQLLDVVAVDACDMHDNCGTWAFAPDVDLGEHRFLCSSLLHNPWCPPDVFAAGLNAMAYALQHRSSTADDDTTHWKPELWQTYAQLKDRDKVPVTGSPAELAGEDLAWAMKRAAPRPVVYSDGSSGITVRDWMWPDLLANPNLTEDHLGRFTQLYKGWISSGAQEKVYPHLLARGLDVQQPQDRDAGNTWPVPTAHVDLGTLMTMTSMSPDDIDDLTWKSYGMGTLTVGVQPPAQSRLEMQRGVAEIWTDLIGDDVDRWEMLLQLANDWPGSCLQLVTTAMALIEATGNRALQDCAI
jgi:hypothetical protein